MVLLSTLTPLDQLTTIEDITSQDWFLLQTAIKTKSCSDPKIQLVYNRLLFYTFWYTEKPHLYLMTNKYYYESQAHTLLPKSYMTMIHKKMPRYINYDSEYLKQYPMVKERVITESNINTAFEVLLNNNFNENPIIHTILGERN